MTTIVVLVALGLATHQGLGGSSDSKPIKAPFDARKWQLDWGDEFDKDGLPDPAKWGYEVGYVRNGESQYYMKARRKNSRVENGRLIIEAHREKVVKYGITSAALNTSATKPFLYGRMEVRAKIPTGRGTWPAIWMLGQDISQIGWPKCGEIDILENVGYDPDKVHANIHVDAYNHSKGTGKGSHLDGVKPWEGYHVYAMEWYPDRLEFFFDDTRYFVFRKERDDHSVWPFDKPQYLIMNLAIGGSWGGAKGIDETLLPHRLEVDYVRFYKPRQ